jgi:hypothetical protein
MVRWAVDGTFHPTLSSLITKRPTWSVGRPAHVHDKLDVWTCPSHRNPIKACIRRDTLGRCIIHITCTCMDVSLTSTPHQACSSSLRHSHEPCPPMYMFPLGMRMQLSMLIHRLENAHQDMRNHLNKHIFRKVVEDGQVALAPSRNRQKLKQ